MRIVRYRDPSTELPAIGLVEDERVVAALGTPFQPEGLRSGMRVGPLSEARLLAPVVPTKVVCVGLNYAAHAAEHDFGRSVGSEPVIFLKPPSAIIGPGEAIILANPGNRTDFEAELAIVIGRRTRNVPEAHALDHVVGYTAGNDVCDRVVQARDGQWMRSKGYDTYCPLGPWIETELDPSNVAVRSRLNGEIRQNSSTAEMVFGVPYLVAFISRVMTLEPGDVIMTGTPEGIGAMQAGDVVEIEIGGIGILRNPVVAAN
jgi:2-keto-4-pentenoate hydratase/2-oxohepta-3-ene-1,7-dioic acid hydratase in catechol pathway